MRNSPNCRAYIHTLFVCVLLIGSLLVLPFPASAQLFPFAFWAKKACPPNYVRVPALAGYTTQDFCVGKYEAKNVGSVGVSQSAGNPWNTINRPNSITACQANGVGYDLMTNAQWQTLARNIELVPSNWSSGVVGTGHINRGNSNSNGSTNGCTGSDGLYGNNGSAGCGSTVNFALKRTHTLSNGEVIWDLAGNNSEWIKDGNSSQGINTFQSLVTNSTAKALFGPAGDYTSLNSGEYGGLGKFSSSSAGGATFRGAMWSAGTEAGIFFVQTAFSNADAYSDMGFRCAYTLYKE
ncbi:hypothetical protein D3C87_258110 [compost metagenome]